MLLEQISFCVVALVFITLAIIRNLKLFISSFKNLKNFKIATEASQHRMQIIEKSAQLDETVKKREDKRKFIKLVLNSYASFNGIVIFVGLISETYLYGGRILGNFISISIAYLFAFFILQPFMYDLEASIKSPYEYLERRFRKWYLRSAACIVGQLFHGGFMTLHLWSCCTILSTIFSQIPFWASSLIFGAYGIMGTIIGGTQSIKINVLQYVIFVTGMVLAVTLTLATHDYHDAGELWDIAHLFGRRNFVNTKTDFITRYTIYSQLFSLPFAWCTLHALNYPSYTRLRSISTKRKSRVFLISNMPFMFITNTLILFGGVVCFTYFYGCDPITNNEIINKNQISSYWILKSLSRNLPSFPGVFLASLVCFAISQYISGITVCTDALNYDVIQPILKRTNFNLNEVKTRIMKIIINICIGIITIYLSTVLRKAKNTVISILFLITNSFNSPIFGLFLLGMFNPYSNHFGAIVSFVINIALVIWFGAGAFTYGHLFKNQEYPPNTFSCDANSNTTSLIGNLTAKADLKKIIELKTFNFTNSTTSDGYVFPEGSTLLFIYSINSVWYCAGGAIFVFTVGSILSFLYSLVTTRSFDADKEHSETRKKYMFQWRRDFLTI